jgi:murein DD-endopeptidase MepM/ murein hydrolase activator NlpD
MTRLLVAAVLLSAMSGPWAAEEIPMIDAHSQVNARVGLDKVLAAMDEAGISRSILSGWGSRRKTREIIEAARAHPDRITPSIDLKYSKFRDGDPAALEQIRREGRSPIFGAMSEVMVLHVQKGNRAPEIVKTLDAPSVQTALAVALARQWPLVMHIEFGYAKDLGRYESYMAALEDLLRRHPDHPFVLSHMGQLDPAAAQRLIEAHRNIYFLTSHANPIFIGRSKLPWTNMFSGDALTSDWKNLLLRYPDRFVLAFDNVYWDDWGSDYVRQVRLWRTALHGLPREVADAIAHGNAERLWRLKRPSAAEPASSSRDLSPPGGANVGPTSGEAATIDPEALPTPVKDLLGRLIASGYGAETNVEGRKRGEPHNAVDIRGKVGDDILAAAPGRVVFAGPTPRGLAVVIAHGRNVDGSWYSTRYVHNSENLVKKGDTVARGQVIAHLGDSGSKLVPHVHFELRRNSGARPTKGAWSAVDPNLYWQADGICFDSKLHYLDRPLRLTLPVRCPM